MLKLKSFINTVLAETWEDTASYIKPDSIEARAEDYDKVPKEVIYLTCAVDVQRDRLEMEIRGWGKDFESWGIEYHTIYGAYDEPTTWTQLHDYLNYPLEKYFVHLLILQMAHQQRVFINFVESTKKIEYSLYTVEVVKICNQSTP
jgi:phage terminase large subunit GpA-like protein